MQEPTFSIGTFAATPPPARVTCAATSSKFVVLGLSSGTLALYDVFGNLLDLHASLHVGPVVSVALGGGPAADEVVASSGLARCDLRAARLNAAPATSAAASPASPDAAAPAAPALTAMLSAATVCLTKLCDHPVVALAVDPHFGKPKFGDRVAYADRAGKVSVFTAGWFGGSEFVLAAPQGNPVFAIEWVQYLLAFAYRDVVKVFDTRANRPVCVVAAPGSSQPPSPMPSPKAGKGFAAATSAPAEEQERDEATPRREGEQGSDGEGEENDGAADEDESRVDGEEKRGEEGVTENGGRRRRGPEGWALKTKIYMETDESAPVSPHKESPVLLYITWPSGARVVQISPHKDIIPTEQNPQRDIEVVYKLERGGLFVPEPGLAMPDEDTIPLMMGNVEEAPLLSLVPFGQSQSVTLVGTPGRGLEIHLVNPEMGKSEKSMGMPQGELHDANLLTIPGGDPLVLIIGDWGTQVAASSDSVDGEAAADKSHEVTYVRSLTTAERVKWLLGQGRFSDALHIAQSAPGGSLRRAEVSLEDIGEQFLESLRESGDYSRLASVLPETITTTTPYVGFRARDRVMEKRKRRWERWIQTFREADKLAIVALVVPTYEPLLAEKSYNSILVELAASDPVVMLDVLKTWPADVFGVSTVTKAIEIHLATTGVDGDASKADREPLREGLLMMYGLSGRHDETLNLLLREESPKVYDYIRSHHLYEAVRSPETITGLFKIDPIAATEILSHAPETVLPPEAVVPILAKVDNSEWTFSYLHAVFKMDIDQAPKYHNQLLKLYVDHGSAGMLFNFLRSSTHYSLDRALREMGGPTGFEEGRLANERVFVLSAMGDLNSAMTILLDELGDTFAAIEFATDHEDTVLWERLIEHAKTHADTLAALLDSPAGGKVDPVRLIPLLNSETRIPHLRDRLHRILVDAALERALREDAAAALHHDASELLQALDESVSLLEV